MTIKYLVATTLVLASLTREAQAVRMMAMALSIGLRPLIS